MKSKTKVNVISTLSFFSAFVLMSGCFETHKWTEKEKIDFECKCTQKDTFSNESIGFKGFENNEFDSVTINEFKDNVLLRSFKISVSFVQNNDQGIVKTRWGKVNKTMNTANYSFFYFCFSNNSCCGCIKLSFVFWCNN